MLPPGYDTALDLCAQKLWIAVQYLHKIGPFNIPSKMRASLQQELLTVSNYGDRISKLSFPSVCNDR